MLTALITALRTEETKRKEQYNIYRNNTLSLKEEFKDLFFNDEDLKNTKVYLLKDLCKFQRGEVIRKDDLKPGNYPLVAGGASPSYSCDRYNRDNECLSVAGSGAYAGTVNYWNKPFFLWWCIHNRSIR